jgi:hypothetical protein
LLLLVVLLLNALIALIRHWREAREARGSWANDGLTEAAMASAGAR